MLSPVHSASDLVFYGEARPASSALHHQMGPFSFVFENGMLKHLRIGSVEIARRVYFAVRDVTWATIPNSISDIQASEKTDAFEITWSGRCQADEVDYEWKGRIRIFAHGLIDFKAQGSALETFKTPRIGLCLLLSTASTLEKPFEVTALDGQTVPLRFEALFKRTQLACRWRSLRFSPATNIHVVYKIDGSYFDLEDQRNFGDVSYKAMAGMPFDNQEALAGKKSEQVLTIRVDSESSIESGSFTEHAPVELYPTVNSRGKIPQIGVDLGGLDASCLSIAIPLISCTNVFLHGWLDCSSPDLMKRAGEIATFALNAARPVYLTLENLNGDIASSIVEVLLNWRQRGVSLLQMDIRESAHPGLMLLKACGREAGISIPCGKRVASFKDRAGLLEAVNSGADFLAWCGTPLSHQDDDETLLENASVFAHQARTARSFAPRAQLTVGPMQLYGNSSAPDARYRGLIAAAFVAASVQSLAEGAVDHALFFDAIGPTGHLSTVSSSQGALDLQVFPSYYVLRELSSFAGESTFSIGTSDALRIQAFGVTSQGGRVVIVVNQTSAPQHATLRGFYKEGSRVLIRASNETTFLRLAVGDNKSLSSIPEMPSENSTDSLTLALEPFSVSFLRETHS